MPESKRKPADDKKPIGNKPSGPTHGKKKRKTRQRKRKLYQKIREDLQSTGDLPTTPEGALKPERVDPRIQTSDLTGLPDILRNALKEQWATPNAAKPAILASLLVPFFQDDVVLDKDGNAVHVRPSRKLLMQLAQTIHMLDKDQWQRDNPAAAGQAKGAGKTVINTAVSVEANMLAVSVLREMFEKAREYGAGETAIPEVVEHNPSDPPRFDGDVEVGAVVAEGEND